MKNQIAPPNDPQTESSSRTEALLDGLIAEAHAIIRDGILPAARAGKYKDWQSHVSDINSLMRSAVNLAEAVGKLRRPEPPPELRQRITVERIENRPPQAVPVRRLSPPQTAQGEGG